MIRRYLKFVSIAVAFLAAPSSAQNVALFLFDGETGTSFAGCLNCSRYDDASICNSYGDYGSRYSDQSIWNRYGDFGSRYETNSPWSRYGEGLRVVDAEGNYYGRFSLARNGQSRLPIIQALLEAYEANDDLAELRDRLCED